MCSEREIISIMLHEAGHITNLDTIKGLGVSIGSSGLASNLLFKTFTYEKKVNDTRAKLMLMVISAILFSYIIWKFPTIYMGRIHEYKADRYAAEYGYGKDLSSSLNKIEKWVKNKHEKEGYNKLDEFFDKIGRFLDVHPETKDRIDALLNDSKFFDAMLKKDKEELKVVIKQHLLVTS
jgi:Zn-dependent protease with chaperone function